MKLPSIILTLIYTIAFGPHSFANDEVHDFSSTEFRVWTSFNGTTFEARIVGVGSDDQYTLEDKTGKRINVTFEQLSGDCQDVALASVINAKKKGQPQHQPKAPTGAPNFFGIEGTETGKTMPNKTQTVSPLRSSNSSQETTNNTNGNSTDDDNSLVGSVWTGHNPLPAAKQKDVIITFKSASQLHWDAKWDTHLDYHKDGSNYQSNHGKIPLFLEIVNSNTMKIKAGKRPAEVFRREP